MGGHLRLVDKEDPVKELMWALVTERILSFKASEERAFWVERAANVKRQEDTWYVWI